MSWPISSPGSSARVCWDRFQYGCYFEISPGSLIQTTYTVCTVILPWTSNLERLLIQEKSTSHKTDLISLLIWSDSTVSKPSGHEHEHKQPRQTDGRNRKGGKECRAVTQCDRWVVKGRVYLASFVFVKEEMIVAYLFCTYRASFSWSPLMMLRSTCCWGVSVFDCITKGTIILCNSISQSTHCITTAGLMLHKLQDQWLRFYYSSDDIIKHLIVFWKVSLFFTASAVFLWMTWRMLL